MDLGFTFVKRNRDSLLMERTDLVLWRATYLRAIRKHRLDDKTIYYLDETWVNAGHTRSKVWKDTTVKTPRDAFNKGLTVGLKNPSGKGERLIVVHAGSSEGFVDGAAEVFRAKKGSGDYHEEMDGARFEKWFTEKLLPNLRPNSVIVMDNASYHSVRLHTLPSSRTRKQAIQEWLTDNDIVWDPTFLKAELLDLVERARLTMPGLQKYRIDDIAEQHGHTVLRLPPYHCELNPIELVWSQVKGSIAGANKTFKLAEVELLTPGALQQVTPDDWKAYARHVIDVENKMWEADCLSDAVIDSVVIHLGSDDDKSSDEDMDDSSDEDMGCESLSW